MMKQSKEISFPPLQNAISESFFSIKLANALYLGSRLMKGLGLESPSMGMVRVNIKLFSDKLNTYVVFYKIPQCFALHKYHSSSLPTFAMYEICYPGPLKHSYIFTSFESQAPIYFHRFESYSSPL